MTRPDILRRTPLVLIATVLGVALLLPLAVAAFGNGQPASLVLGHDDYTTSDSLTWRKLKGPADVVVDPVTGKVFVSDSQNHRVLRFSAESAFESNLPAEAVLGQPTRSSIAPGTTAARMEWPRGLLVDGEGRLWVADAGNSRVLRFDNAASKPTGAPADGVLGQPDFTSDAWAATAQRLYAPHGLAMDSSGQLWVADAGNHRVLRFDNAAGKPNGAAADAVLGQPGFTSATSGWTAQSMNQPQAVAVDTAGRLWVGDTNNHRVLRFDAVASKPNGAPADGLLGQTDYVPVTFPYQPIDRRVIPFDLQADSAGRLWVAEIGDRVLRFDNAASKPNGTPADGVLGQATLNDHAYPWPAQDRMNNPQGIALDMAGRLWVVDTGNNRVLRFDNVAAKASGAPADGLLGPDNFDGTLNPTDRHFSVPVGVAVDPVSGKLFVADGFHNRVLRFGRVDSLISGTAAEAVLGQPDFTRSDPRAGSEGMSVPAGLAFDSSGRLWVADTRNSRVLRFDNAASKPNGAAADGVLGQPNFASHDRATTQQGMSMPFDVAVDQTGRLWVADGYNKRVLRFDNAANKPDGALADGVLGQLDFESRVIATTQQSVGEPEGVTVDNNGRLWVSDGTNGRVLRFDNAASKSDGAPADGVLGQPDFTSSTISTTQSGLYRVGAVEIDSAGRLWVADFGNARVLMFEAAATKPDGGAADLVLGQSGFTTGTPATSQEGLRSPWALTLDGDGHLWVTESSNNRVLMFEPDGPAPTATATASETPSQTPTATVSLTPSLTPSQTPTATASETPSLTPSQTPSATPSLTPSVTPSSTPSQTPSVTPSLVPSLTPSRTPSVTPGLTPTAPAQPALVPRAYIPAVRR